MKDYLDGHSKVGIVGPKVLDLDGELQKAGEKGILQMIRAELP